jgi:hypothetical protein
VGVPSSVSGPGRGCAEWCPPQSVGVSFSVSGCMCLPGVPYLHNPHSPFSGSWCSPGVSGTRPPPCAFFSFTAIDQHRAVVFGGRTQTARVSDTYILDMTKMVSYYIGVIKLRPSLYTQVLRCEAIPSTLHVCMRASGKCEHAAIVKSLCSTGAKWSPVRESPLLWGGHPMQQHVWTIVGITPNSLCLEDWVLVTRS